MKYNDSVMNERLSSAVMIFAYRSVLFDLKLLLKPHQMIAIDGKENIVFFKWNSSVLCLLIYILSDAIIFV